MKRLRTLLAVILLAAAIYRLVKPKEMTQSAEKTQWSLVGIILDLAPKIIGMFI